MKINFPTTTYGQTQNFLELFEQNEKKKTKQNKNHRQQNHKLSGIDLI